MPSLKSIAYIFLLFPSFLWPTLAQSKTPSKNEAEMLDVLSRIPLSFEQNQGQSDPRVKYLSRGVGYNIVLTSQGAEIVPSNARHQGEIISIRLAGSAKQPKLLAMEPLTQKTNYLIGNDPAQHVVDVKNYGRIQYSSVYPGIDLIYYGNQQQLEYDLVVAPKADPKKIKLKFGGTHKLTVTPEGELKLGDPSNGMTFLKPFAYQDIDGKRHPVEAEYLLAANNQASFKLGKYDTNFPLIIDPILSYATYLWGKAGGIATDSSGYIYVAGTITSKDLPVVGGYKTTQSGTNDAYVIKIDPSSSQAVYATYLGARRAITNGVGIAVDSAGNAYVTGTTDSSAYPVTSGAYQTTSSTGGAFITKLNAAGNALVYSTFVKGATPKSIVVDNSGNSYITGSATSSFISTTGAFQTSYRGGFVAKLNSSGNAMVYATYLGGSSASDFCNAIATDAQGNAYVAGTTFSADFPTATPYQASLRGQKDAFVTKINPAGTALIYSTYLGGSDNEYGKGITVDAAGQAYVVGWTNSGDYPVILGAFQLRKGYADPAVSNAFITKLSDTGTALIYSSYLGGAWCLRTGVYSCYSFFGDAADGIDVATSVVVDAAGYAYLGGYATSAVFPMNDSIRISNIQGADNDSAPFVAKISPNGDQKIFSAVFSVREQDKRVSGLAVDANGNVYAVGYSSAATSAPITAGALLTTQPLDTLSPSSFLVKLSSGLYTTLVESSSNPATNAQAITLTARVSSAKTGGTVTFMDGGTMLGVVPVDKNQSTLTTTLSPGVHKITAVYSGDSKTSPPIYQLINSY